KPAGPSAPSAPVVRETCRPTFASGLNVAWLTFAADLPNPDIAKFRSLIRDSVSVGGRVVRWWFHTNGSLTPGYDAAGMAKPIAPSLVMDLKVLLDAAHEEGASLVISLWSFDMLQPNAGGALEHNRALLTRDANRDAYVSRFLTPLVAAL